MSRSNTCVDVYANIKCRYVYKIYLGGFVYIHFSCYSMSFIIAKIHLPPPHVRKAPLEPSVKLEPPLRGTALVVVVSNGKDMAMAQN